jgi:hypothetical protein
MKLNTFLKILFCVIAFVLVMLTVLANMGGNSQFHKESVEQFVSEATGYKSKVATLVSMTYFPSIAVDFEDLDLADANGVPAAHVDKAQASVSFWDVLRQSGRMKILNVHGVHMASGVFLDKPVEIKSLGIVDGADASSAKLEGRGHIGQVPMVFSLSMESKGEGSSRKYWFGRRREFIVEFGEIKISGALQNGANPYISVPDFKVNRSGSDIITGRIDISKRRAREITIGGELTLVEYGSILKPDLLIDLINKKITGPIASDNFKSQDFAAGSAFDDLVNRFVQVLGDLKKDEKILDEFFAAQEITLNGKKLAFENNTLSLK